MSKGYKGGDFEREVCKLLSKWWTNGERDDIFWRSSQSGGRATQRAKFGKRTYGSYGDIAAVDPIGEPLLKLFTIELKRGSSHSSPGDLLDFKAANASHPWAKCIQQAARSAEDAKSVGWMMICRRDHRRSVVFLESRIFKFLREGNPIAGRFPMMSFHLTICKEEESNLGDHYHFVGLPLDTFLTRITPQKIIMVVKHLT